MSSSPDHPDERVADQISPASAPGADPTRVDTGIKSLRRHAARGTLVNSGFQVGLAGLGALQRVAVAAFLTRTEFGIWGIVLVALVTLNWLKQIGIADKFIQQSEPDQERAFQKAFTLELGASGVYFALVLLLIPVYAVLYGTSEIILPAVVASLYVPLTALESPAWIAYRRMQYVRQRLLTAADPVVAFIVTVALGAAGFGYWCLVIGLLAGGTAGALVCVLTCPYRLRFRFDRGTLREYASFSWPLLGGGLSRLIVVQGALIAVNRSAGLAAIGSIGLATSVAILADRVDAIVSQTIYPAVCAVADRLDVLHETFVKSNRIALMWAIPFATGVALFAHDLTALVLGSRWVPAAPLMAAMALSSGLGQVAFNWAVFMRALNRTRPILVGAAVDFGVFLVFSVPAIIAFGLTGYAAAFAAAASAQLLVRNHYMRELFPNFNVLAQLLRSITPVAPAAGFILVLRWLAPGDRSLGRAIAELVIFLALSAGSTYLSERKLVLEIAGYLRGQRNQSPLTATAS